MPNLSLDNIKPETTTALGQTIGGASPDKAKMAGTPNQVKGAIQKNTASPAIPKLASEKKSTGMAFSDALRKARPDLVDATLEEQINKDRTEREMILGKARMDAKDIISQASAGETIETATATKDDVADTLKEIGIDFSDSASASDKVANLSQAQQEEVINKLASKNPDLADQLSSKFLNKKIVVNKLLDDFASSQNISDPAAKDSYYETIAKDLGLTSKDELLNLSSADFIKRMEDSIARDTSQVRSLNQTISSPSASPAEKAAAQAELVRLGAFGSRTLQEETAELSKNINKLDDIVVGGKTYASLNDIIKDRELAALISRGLDSDPANKEDQEAALATLKEVGLYTGDGNGIVDKYGKALKDKLAADKNTLAGIMEGQKEISNFLKLGPDATLSSQIAKSVIPEWDGTKLTSLPSSLKNFSALVKSDSFNDAERTKLANVLNTLSNYGQHDMVKVAAQLTSAAELKKLIPNLELAAKAEASQDLLDSINPQNVSYDNIKSLASSGLIKPEDADLYEQLGIPAKEIYDNIQENLVNVDEWKKVSPEMKPFAAEIFAPKPFEIRSSDWNKVFGNWQNTVNIDTVNKLDGLVSRMPYEMQKQYPTIKKKVINDFTVNTTDNIIDKNNYTWPEKFSSEAEFRTHANARNAVIQTSINQLNELLQNPEMVGKLDTNVMSGRINALTNQLMTEDKINKQAASIAQEEKARKESEAKIALEQKAAAKKVADIDARAEEEYKIQMQQYNNGRRSSKPDLASIKKQMSTLASQERVANEGSTVGKTGVALSSSRLSRG